MSNTVRAAGTRVARASRKGADSQTLMDARRDLTTAKLERAIQEAINTAPPITTDQRAHLVRLLANGGAAK